MRSLLCLAIVAFFGIPIRTVQAHFKLLAPASWVNEDSSGGPQKGPPCGPGGADSNGDAVPMSMKVTTVHAGDMLEVEVEETIHHPGWFRIALASDRSTFKDPEFPNADCTVDMSTVPTGPHDNVLADGLAMDTDLAGANRHLKEQVKIPDQPCDKCTLQVIQVMADVVHRPPGCIYYHCADLQILPATNSAGSSGAPAAAGSSSSTAGASGSAAGAGGGTGTAAGSTAGQAGTSASAGNTAAGAAGGAVTAPTGAAGKPSTPTSSTSNAMTASAAGAAAAAHGGATAGSAGASAPSVATPSTPAPTKSGGCSVARVTERGSHTAAAGFGGAGVMLVLGLRRARRRSTQRQASV